MIRHSNRNRTPGFSLIYAYESDDRTGSYRTAEIGINRWWNAERAAPAKNVVLVRVLVRQFISLVNDDEVDGGAYPIDQPFKAVMHVYVVCCFGTFEQFVVEFIELGKRVFETFFSCGGIQLANKPPQKKAVLEVIANIGFANQMLFGLPGISMHLFYGQDKGVRYCSTSIFSRQSWTKATFGYS